MKSNMGGDRDALMAEINMIPLIDVSLVLLIIFMVMTPMLVRSQIQVNLPKATPQQQADEKQTLDIQVTKQGDIYFKDQLVPPAEIEETLRRNIPDPANQAVIIEADKESIFDNVVQIMDAAKKIGVTKLGVGVLQKKTE